MNIGDVAQRSGLPAKTIRYYEDIGLITPMRDSNGYRRFRDSDLHKRYLKKLNVQEDKLETILAETEDTREAFNAANTALGDYIRGLEI